MADRYFLKGLILLVLLLTFSCSQSPIVDVDCEINSGPCIKEIGGSTVVFDITPKPVRAMRRLEFSIAIKQKETLKEDRLLLKLSMPGMDMGENAVLLHRSEDGTYKGQGVIVRCPSGKTIWRADIEIPGLGSTYFVFDVKP
ncbi:MAG: hypothetical protein GXO99_05200 [Nitrospirae bacterium]|nr:hypothetical protein [Nitrospirota bacterium]